MSSEIIRKKVLEVYKECNIHNFPIDCFSILKHYGLKPITYQETHHSNPELYNAIIRYSRDAFKFRRSVYYNSKNNIGRIRFSLMHELGHFILGHDIESKENEEQADIFASNILAPRTIVNRNGFKTSDQIHDYFLISYAAANCVVAEMKHWDATTTDNQILRFIDAPAENNDVRDQMDIILSIFEALNQNMVCTKAKYYI